MRAAQENREPGICNYVVIPAFEPDFRLLSLVKGLSGYPGIGIIVVNDGSEKGLCTLFGRTAEYATVLFHRTNRGKGRAVKTALDYIRKNRKEAKTIVIADADGQHKAEDILRVLHAAQGYEHRMVLGVRSFSGEVPFRSKFGNAITCAIFYCVTGTFLSDTQTGLRAFHVRLIPLLLRIRGERYEFEMNTLMQLSKRRIKFEEVGIETVYLDQNESSHFRVIRDSVRIYWNIIKFACSSMASFAVDYGLFLLFCAGLSRVGAEMVAAVAVSNAAARVISACCNFCWNRKYVLHHKGSSLKAGLQYFSLALAVLCINTALLSWLVVYGRMGKARAKLCAELSLFALSFIIQRFMIFGKKEIRQAQ